MQREKKSLYSLIFFRFLIATVILIINTAVFGLAHTQVYILVSVIYFLTIIYSVLVLLGYYKIPFLFVQIIIDLFIEVLLIHYTGGIDSVLGILIPLSTIAAGIIISGKAAIFVALFGSVLYTAIISLEFLNLMPLPERFLLSLKQESTYVFSLLYFRVTVFCIIGFLSSYISEQLRKKDKAVIALEMKLRREDRLSAIGKLAANTAHEIRNPLASISGCVEALNESLALEGNNKKLFNLIIKETKRLNDIINGLLEYVKPRSLKIQEVNLWDIIDEVVFLVENSKDFKGKVRIIKEANNKQLNISCDVQQIKQVFFNLLINAVEAINDNGKIVINAIIDKENNQLVINIIDNGHGISKDQINTIFEPFTSEKENGVGLGLAIVYSIIKEHNGNIKVESKKNKGTKFSVMLPLLKEIKGEKDAR